MLTPEINAKIWRYLKSDTTDNSARAVASSLSIPYESVLEFVDENEKRGFVELIDGRIIIRFVLDPIHQARDTTKFYDYNFIRKNMPQGLEPIPRKYMSPALEYLPDYCDQGQRGTCVGWSMAIGLTMLHILELIKNGLSRPDPRQVQHGVIEKPEGMSCSFTREIYYSIWKSAQFIYYGARKRGNVTHPSGAWLEDAVPFVKETGTVLEEEIYTSTTDRCVPEFYPWCWKQGGSKTIEQAYKAAGAFKIKGFSTTVDFDTCCRMIYEQGCAWVGVTIYDNYQSKGCVGVYPEPNGIADGGHAQVAVGYDLDKGEIYFKQTWKRWKGLGGVTRNYWNYKGYDGIRAVDNALCSIGVVMKDVADKLYSKVYISSNVDVAFYFDDVKRPEKREFVVAVERGTTHKIKAVAPLNTTVEGYIERTITPLNEQYIEEFKFTSISTKQKIRDMIIAIFRKLGVKK